jgi:hypothetical protein
MAEKITIDGFRTLGGKHCWTTSVRHSLECNDLHLSEEMLFGLGGGISFFYWYMKMMPAPFIGGRYGGKDSEPIINTFRRIGGDARISETSSAKKGHEELKAALGSGETPIVFVDMAYLPYVMVPENAHFGGHTIVVYEIDEVAGSVMVADRSVNGFSLRIDDLKKARSSKFLPFPPKNRLVVPSVPEQVPDLSAGITASIADACKAMLEPPISNGGLAGMKKWASVVTKWPSQFKGMDLLFCLFNTYIYLETGGTGGGCFRPMYSKFLDESCQILNDPRLAEASALISESAEVWKEIAEGSLPDWWDALGEMRSIVSEKNRIFEQQGPAGFARMRELSDQGDHMLQDEAVIKEFTDLDQAKMSRLLNDTRDRILKVHQIESKAFRLLNEVVT